MLPLGQSRLANAGLPPGDQLKEGLAKFGSCAGKNYNKKRRKCFGRGPFLNRIMFAKQNPIEKAAPF
jgi:hypothetical protein